MNRFTTTTYENQSQTALVITDDGNGGLMWGNTRLANSKVNYASGEITINKAALQSEITEPQYSPYQMTQGAVATSTVSGSVKTLDTQIIAPNTATVSRITADDTRTISETIKTGLQTYDVLQGLPYPYAALLNSWVFEIDGSRIIERNGVLYRDWNNIEGTGSVVGYFNVSGELRLTRSNTATPTVKILQGVYVNGKYEVQSFCGRTASAPIKPQSFTVYADVDGHTLQGKAHADESLHGEITGTIDSRVGFFDIRTSQPIAPDSLRYNAVSQSTIPLDSTVIGINAVRLPLDGKVPVFRKGDMIVIGNRLKHDLGSAHRAGQTIQLPRQNLDRLCIVDAKGTHLNAIWYDYDLDAGTLTWAIPLDLSDYQMPLMAGLIWEEENRVVDADISGRLKLQFGVSRDYPLENTYVSSAILGGDLAVRASEPFSQKAWTNVWQDTRIGDEILAKINVADYPIKLTSDGAITERWLMKFTTSQNFQLYGERLGLVAESDIFTELAPINAATGKPYFKLLVAAMNGGFEAQNCVRFNTYGTPMPVWILRAVQPSPKKAHQRDGFRLCLRGNTVETA